MTADRPNVLLVVLDAARRDALEPYGAAPGSTPAIAQLAGRGRALPSVHATACWTVPSHGSMLTGLMPRAAGLARVPSPAAARSVAASHSDRLLPAVLARAGYATGGVSANLWVSEASGLDQGFESFDLVDSGRHARFGDPGRAARLRWLVEAARGRVDDGAAAAASALERRVAQRGERPFFLLANVVECHSPYLPPRPYGAVSTLDRVRAAADAQRYYNLESIWRVCSGGFEVPPEALERMRRLYHGAIRWMDDWLAGVLERLNRAGVLDDTLVVVVSDHGENFGEGGLISHSHSLDERLIHVPFVAAGPGAGELDLTSLAELPAAVAAAVGLGDHPWVEPGVPAGMGVAQYDPPAARDDPRAEAAVERWGGGEEVLRRLTTPLTCAVAGGTKLLLDGDRESVFDLGADPLELRPLDPAGVPAARRGELEALRAALRHPAMTARRDDGEGAAASGASEAELRALEERMKLLGYM